MIGSGKDVQLDLVDQDGRRFATNELLGTPALVYFGFLNCRVVCPRSLAKIANICGQLASNGRLLRVLYISVDPDRDTPEAMKAHLALHHPSFTGLTGTAAQIERAKREFRVFSQRAADDTDPAGYAVPHTAFIYLIDAEARIIAHFADTRTAEEIARAIVESGILRSA